MPYKMGERSVSKGPYFSFIQMIEDILQKIYFISIYIPFRTFLVGVNPRNQILKLCPFDVVIVVVAVDIVHPRNINLVQNWISNS